MITKFLSWLFPVRLPSEPLESHRTANVVNFLEYRERRRRGFTLDS